MSKQLLKWHNRLMWFGLATILCWAISGITHPIMAWFGPQASKMFPPRFQLQAEQVNRIEKIIREHNLQQAAVAKLVPGAAGPLLQVTENETTPRRYFALADSQEIAHQDVEQAKWLASYYSGRPIAQVQDVEFRSEFSSDYPRVNRLLPVYKVTMGQGGDSVSLFVYTENSALAAINNPFKESLQKVFQALHTWSWLDVSGHGRVVIIAFLMLTLLAMAVTGLLLVVKLPKRRIPDRNRRWHRWASYVLWLPLLGWSASGFYHLLQAQYVQPVSGVKLAQPVNLQNWLTANADREARQTNLQASLQQADAINALALVKTPTHSYRLSIAQPPKVATGIAQRKQRFGGAPTEKSALYINAHSGQLLDHTDKAQAIALLNQQFDVPPTVEQQTLVTRFGPNYDFRNKRLPVWQLDLADEYRTRLFIDPASSVLVDQNRAIDRMESWSFSLLHKWNLLRPLLGRQWRDMLIVVTLVAALVAALFGLKIYLVRRSKTRRAARATCGP
ncbi:PepSY domain-containing protein [Porticoccus sp. GXU_MW_L64]